MNNSAQTSCRDIAVNSVRCSFYIHLEEMYHLAVLFRTEISFLSADKLTILQ